MRTLVRLIYIIILIVVLYFSFLFIDQNSQLVTLQIPLLAGTGVEARLATLVIAAASFGGVMGMLISIPLLLITKGKLIKANRLLKQSKK